MLYEKAWACNYDELITYYPLFYRGVKEMDAILRAHGKLADGLEADIERVFGNQFIDTMDEAAIGHMEKFLNIGLNASRTLEERKRIIKPYFAGLGKVSASAIEAMIKSYSGAEVKSRLEAYDDAGNQALFIDIARGEKESFYMDDILKFLNMKMPAHILTRANVNYQQRTTVRTIQFLGAGACMKVKPALQKRIKAVGQNDIRASTFFTMGLKAKAYLAPEINANGRPGFEIYLRGKNSMKIGAFFPTELAAKAEGTAQADLRLASSMAVKYAP